MVDFCKSDKMMKVENWINIITESVVSVALSTFHLFLLYIYIYIYIYCILFLYSWFLKSHLRKQKLTFIELGLKIIVSLILTECQLLLDLDNDKFGK